jgi:hypothetical protein
MVPGWLVLLMLGLTLIACAITVSMGRMMKTQRTLLDVQHRALTEAMAVIDCLSQRGLIMCDVCHQPIAPRTPTDMEFEDGQWSIAHARCSE